MNCCNANGNCDQGRDCPIRKQRTKEAKEAKEANDAYMKAQTPSLNRIWDNKEDRIWDDPLDDFAASIKGLIALIVVVVIITLIAFAIWGK